MKTPCVRENDNIVTHRPNFLHEKQTERRQERRRRRRSLLAVFMLHLFCSLHSEHEVAALLTVVKREQKIINFSEKRKKKEEHGAPTKIISLFLKSKGHMFFINLKIN